LKGHPNIVSLLGAFASVEMDNTTRLNIVLEFVSDTLHRIIKHYNSTHRRMDFIKLKLYTYQLLRGLNFVHMHAIVHADIKPQNLLVDGRSHALKLCDFGSAKRLIKGEPNVAYICSRYYRAPELIFGATDYTMVIDIWSTACVTAELILGQPIFPGESGVDQLVEIIKVLGTPTREELMAMNPNYTEFKFPQIKPHPWHKVFRSKTSPEAIDYISKPLVYDPKLRPSGLQCCTHNLFDELRDQNTRISNSKHLPPFLLNFSKEEQTLMDHNLKQKLIPEWVTTTNKEIKA